MTTSSTPAAEHEETGLEPIAIIGMAARTAGAGSVEQLWTTLLDGVEASTRFDRDDQIAKGVGAEDVDDPDYVPRAFVVEDFDAMDITAFGMTAREAELADPQQRILLELAETALEDAGVDPSRFEGDVGVYAGGGSSVYGWDHLQHNPEIVQTNGALALSVGNSSDYLATTISYRLDLRGPAMTVTTACSTSLVATHLACEALRNHECDMAIAGGSSIELPHGAGYVSSEGYTSSDGHVRPFGADARGTMWGSGAGAVVLRRLSDALRDGDPVRAVIRGNAVNNDGSSKVGFSAPSVPGQVAVVSQAYHAAGISPTDIGYVEAHGTGTHLGDPIEIEALSRAFAGLARDQGLTLPERQWCAVGSIKGNIGHLSQAAGVVGLIKAALVVERGVIPPSINAEQTNPAIDFESGPFFLARTMTAFESDGRPRRAGVSSFGIGGTNAHVILEQAPEPVTAPPDDEPQAPTTQTHLLTLSAHTATALEATRARLLDRLAADPGVDLADVARTLTQGRPQRRHREAVVLRAAGGAGGAEVATAAFGRRHPAGVVDGSAPRIGLLFSGQGSQYPGMGHGLYRASATYRAVIDECADLLTTPLGLDLRDVLARAPGDVRPDLREELDRTWLTQPALFTLEYALGRMWLDWGVEPAALLGHSIGEYAAATLAGVFDLPAALRVVTERGRLMQSMQPGTMAAVQLDEDELRAQLPPELEIATVNGPGTTVIGGPTESLETFLAAAAERGIGAKTLRTSHAFHTASMEPVLTEFTRVVAEAAPGAPHLPVVSNLSGTFLTDEQATSPEYWAAHLRSTVRFGDGVATLLADGEIHLLECGPGRQLAGLSRMQTRGGPTPRPSLPGPGDGDDDLAVAYEAAGALWCAGAEVTPATSGAGRRIPLPTYPYERTRHFVEKLAAGSSAPSEPFRSPGPAVGTGTGATVATDAATPAPLSHEDLAAWFAMPVWRQLPALGTDAPSPDDDTGATPTDGGGSVDLRRVLLVGNGPRATALAHEMLTRGVQVRLAAPESLTHASAPTEAHVVHAVALDDGGVPPGEDAGSEAAESAFHGVISLLQAISTGDGAAGRQVSILTPAAQRVLDEQVDPGHALAAGPTRVAPLELAGLQTRWIDTDDASPARLLAELLAVGQPSEVSLRGGRRWTREMSPIRLGAGDAPAFRDGGRYLVTGGTGGIGITLAEHLATRHRARLVLTSRTGLPPRESWDDLADDSPGAERIGRAVAAVRRMEAAGAVVLVAAVDVTDAEALRTLMEQARDAWGGLDGVVHAAGIAGGGMIEVKDATQAEAVLAPKVAGTAALRRAVRDAGLDLDLVVLCSSITSVTGGFGQVDYCAGNAVLDAEAGSGRWDAPVVSVSWGGWSHVGMAVETERPAALATRVDGPGPAEPGSAASDGGPPRRVDHPLITRHGTHDGADWAEGDLDPAAQWVLDQHRIGGIPVLPGTGHLECARAAFEACFPVTDDAGTGIVALTDVVFLEPLRVPDGSTGVVRVEFTAESDGAEPDGRSFVVTSTVQGPDGGTRTHVQGVAERVPATPPPRVDVATLTDGLASKDAEAASMYRSQGRTSLVRLGPRWDALREHWLGRDGEVATIERPAATGHDGSEVWGLDPALLDVATAFSDRGEGTYLPMGYGRIVVHRPLPDRFHSVLTHRGGADVSAMVTADLSLVDPNGEILVDIREFALRRVDADAVAGPDGGPAGPDGGPAGPGAPAGNDLDARPTDLRDLERVPGQIAPPDGIEALIRVLQHRPAAHVVINPWRMEDAFALTRAAGSRVGAAAEEAPDPTGASAAPPTSDTAEDQDDQALESTIAGIWSSVLGVAEVDADDDFFGLGGNSLVAVQLIGQVRKAVGVRLPMRTLFDGPTVREMADQVRALREQG